MKLDKLGRKRIETCKNKGGSDNRPNILSLSQTERIVNQKFVINYNFCILFKKNYALCTILRLAFLKNRGMINIQRGDTNDLLKQDSNP